MAKKSYFQFGDPRIVRLEFHINEEFDREKFEGFEIENEVSNAVIEEGKEALVKLGIRIGNEEETVPFSIVIEMVGKFRMEEVVSEEIFRTCLDVNAPSLLMSYARPIVTLVTAQAGFPAFNLPFVNFTEE